MEEIKLEIDGTEVKTEKGKTVLEAAKDAGIRIPTLCYHEALEPFGMCRLCTVEVEAGGRKRLVASCLYSAEDGLVVRTRTPEIEKIRKTIIEMLLAHAPDAPVLVELAEEYGAKKDHFRPQASFCVLCGLCVRYCSEVKQKNAIAFVGQGSNKEICFIPEIASEECWKCKECFPLCPTEALQATYLLTQAMAFPQTET